MSAQALTSTVIAGIAMLVASCGTAEPEPSTPPEPTPSVVEATGPGAGEARPLDGAETEVLTSRILAIRTDWGAGRYDAARRAAQSLVDDYPDREDVHDLALEVCGDDEAARLVELKRWLAHQPDSAVTLHQLAQCLIDPDLPSDLRDPFEATEVGQQALIALGRADANYLVTLGTAFYLAGNTKKAIEAYENAILANSRGLGALDNERELQEFIETLKKER